MRVRAAAIALMLLGAAGLPAGAQTALSTAGDVGSATVRNGFPGGSGVVTLPVLQNAISAVTGVNTAAKSAATTGSEGGGSGGGGGGSGGGRGGSGSAGATASGGSSRGGGSNWVLCPPSGGSGLAPFLTGTDLSCAPN